MDTVVDGCICRGGRHGGIARIYSEILPRICTLGEPSEIVSITSGQNHLPHPNHKCISYLTAPVRRQDMRWV